MKTKPDFAPAANNLAWLVANSKEPDLGEALRLAMIAKKMLPDNPNISDTLGWVHYQRNSPSLAKSQFEHALTVNPDNPTIRYHLALSQDMAKKPQQAINSLKEAIASSVPFPEKEQAKTMLDRLTQNNDGTQ